MNEQTDTTNASHGGAGATVLLEPEAARGAVGVRRAESEALPRLDLGGEVASLPEALAAQVRRQFFCSAAEAARHRVGVDEVIEHLARAGLALGPRPQRVTAHLGDVILAVACVRGDAAAWNDLLNAHAWCLDRACAEQMGASSGLAFARRFWSDLRAATLGRPTTASRERTVTRLQAFTGTRPIRLWLADRLLGGAAVAGGATPAPRSHRLDRARESRTLPLPVADAGGTAT